MKILWISQNLPYPPKTGVLQRNYNLLREASKLGEVHLVAIVKEDILPDFDAELAIREISRLCASVSPVRLRIERSATLFWGTVLRSLFTAAPFTVNWADSPDLAAALQRAASAMRYDVIYFDTISLAQYGPLFSGTRLALNHHNIESELFATRTTYEPNPIRRSYFRIESKKLRRYEAAVAADFDVHLVVSNLDADRLRDVSPGVHTHVVANGVDLDYFRAEHRHPEQAHLIMVSGMNWFPNRDAALYMVNTIWPLVSAAVPDTRLTIVGASPPREITELAGRDPRVRVTGFVDDVRPFMQSAHVYLCPMRDGGGTRLKILDALAMRLPVVSTTMGIEGIPVQNGKEVLLADTPEAFRDQIIRLLNDRQLSAQIGDSGRAFVEQHFGWPAIGRELGLALTPDQPVRAQENR